MMHWIPMPAFCWQQHCSCENSQRCGPIVHESRFLGFDGLPLPLRKYFFELCRLMVNVEEPFGNSYTEKKTETKLVYVFYFVCGVLKLSLTMLAKNFIVPNQCLGNFLHLHNLCKKSFQYSLVFYDLIRSGGLKWSKQILWQSTSQQIGYVQPKCLGQILADHQQYICI